MHCLAIALATHNFKGAIKSKFVLQATRIRSRDYKHESYMQKLNIVRYS